MLGNTQSTIETIRKSAMEFDIWGFLKAEALAPGIVFGSYDQICRACEKAYVVHVDNNHHTLSTCPYCNTQNET